MPVAPAEDIARVGRHQAQGYLRGDNRDQQADHGHEHPEGRGPGPSAIGPLLVDGHTPHPLTCTRMRTFPASRAAANFACTALPATLYIVRSGLDTTDALHRSGRDP